MPRCVTGTPAYAAAAMPAVIPGTTSTGTPSAISSCASSPPRPKTNGSPPLSRTTDRPGARVLEQQRVRRLLRDLLAAADLADVDDDRVLARLAQRLERDEPVVQHDVGAAQQLEGPRGEQPRIARPGADEVDRAGPHATSASARRSTSPPPAASTRSAASAPSASGVGGAALDAVLHPLRAVGHPGERGQGRVGRRRGRRTRRPACCTSRRARARARARSAARSRSRRPSPRRRPRATSRRRRGPRRR